MKCRFHEYRYQIIAKSPAAQAQICRDVPPLLENIANKNRLFKQAIAEMPNLSFRSANLERKPILIDDSLLVIQIGIEKDISRKNKNFKRESVENWDTAYIAFDNKPDVQKALVQWQHNFQSSTVIKIITENVNKFLLLYGLEVRFEPIFDKRKFWDLVRRYEGKITQADFELISPNMANLSKELLFDLKSLHNTTNTTDTHIQLNSSPGACLTLTPDDAIVNGMVNYAASGGGDISLRIRGMKSKQHTSTSINESSIDEVDIEHASADDIGRIFKNLLNENN